MTIDEAIKQTESVIFLSRMAVGDVFQTNNDYWDTVLSALLEKKEEEKNEPLSPEELCRVDYDPLWIEDLEDDVNSQWRICYLDLGKYFCSHGGKSNRGYLLQEYGETWLAYRHKKGTSHE